MTANKENKNSSSIEYEKWSDKFPAYKRNEAIFTKKLIYRLEQSPRQPLFKF